ncbi:hypothetical protein Bbelb_334290 [Branchiostoma belcheri]|nr:hypothetical protein Bbelb_334290 [Branchiostoma belcheri]
MSHQREESEVSARENGIELVDESLIKLELIWHHASGVDCWIYVKEEGRVRYRRGGYDTGGAGTAAIGVRGQGRRKENISVEEVIQEVHKKLTTFLAVRATGDSSKVYVIIQGQPIAECHRVLEARGVTFIEHHVVKKHNMNEMDLSPAFKLQCKKYIEFKESLDTEDIEMDGTVPEVWVSKSIPSIHNGRTSRETTSTREPPSRIAEIMSQVPGKTVSTSAIEQLKQGLKLLGLREALEAEPHLIAALLCKSTEEVNADSIAEMLIHSTTVCFVYSSSSQIMSKTNRQAKQTKPSRTESGAGSTPKSARPTTPVAGSHLHLPGLEEDFEVLAVAMNDKPGDDGHLSHASFKQQALKWGNSPHVTPYIHTMVYHLPHFLEKYRYLNDLSCESVEQDNGSVDQETARSNKRPAVLVVKQMQKDVQVYVVIHGKPLTRTTSLLEGFVSLMGALYLFQLTYSSYIASAMVFIEYHILRDANIHRKDLSTGFLKAYKTFESFLSDGDDSDEDTRLPATHMMEEEGNFKHHLKPPRQPSSHYHVGSGLCKPKVCSIHAAALTEEMGLKSGVQHVARNCADHHKSMEMILIAIKGSTEEMLELQMYRKKTSIQRELKMMETEKNLQEDVANSSLGENGGELSNWEGKEIKPGQLVAVCFSAPRRFHVGKVLKSDIEEQEVQVQFYKPARKNLLVNFGAPEWVTPNLSKDGVTLLPPSKSEEERLKEKAKRFWSAESK